MAWPTPTQRFSNVATEEGASPPNLDGASTSPIVPLRCAVFGGVQQLLLHQGRLRLLSVSGDIGVIGSRRMAYTFNLTGTRRGPDREAISPYTAKPATCPTFLMSDEESAAVLAVISRHGGAIEDRRGSVVLTGAEMTFRDFDGPMFGVSITGSIEPAIGVLFEIATAGRLIVMNDHEKCDEPVPVVTTAEAQAQAEASEADRGPPELVTEVDRFLRVLLPGYDR